jgi:hypothetical protein
MGYRSDVAYLIIFGDSQDKDHARSEEGKERQNKALDKFCQFIAEAKVKEETAGCFKEEVEGRYDEGLYINYEAGYIKFEAQQVKWYEDYDDVTCHTNLLKLADDYIDEVKRKDKINDDDMTTTVEYEISISYSFVRIGEEYEDIEVLCNGMGNASELLYPTRGIYIDI